MHELQNFLNGGGTMGARMRSFDWAASSLGPPSAWPQSLKTIVRVMLDSRFAMWMAWGPEGIFFCNDAYSPTLGIKQDWALGARSDKVWEEIWHDIGPRIQHVLTTAQATWDEGLQLFLRRSGYDEETFHTFSYSPVYDDANRVVGMLCVVAEDTERVIGERRLGVLRELAAAPAAQEASLAAAGEVVMQVLAGDQEDVPFAAMYLAESEARALQIAATSSFFSKVDPLSPDWVYRFKDAGTSQGNLLVDVADAKIQGPWKDTVTQAMVFPLDAQGISRSLGYLMLGVSTRRPLDAGYRSFLGLVADQFASQLANTHARLEAENRARALAELDRAKNLFFSNASHELRTPLTLVLGPLDHLRGRPGLPVDVVEQLELAHRNALRLRKLVNSLLDFSRIEAGRMQVNHEATDLSAYTADIASSFRAAIEQVGLKFNVQCELGTTIARVDRDMWEKVVLNLLSNALKFTFSGEISVEISSSRGLARLVVRDTGVGIDDAELPRIFERFHRVVGAASRSNEGTGIGLALVKELVKLHGGDIAVRSRKGAGTSFTVTLPVGEEGQLGTALVEATLPRQTQSDRQAYVDDATRAEEALEQSSAAPLTASEDRGRARILVADDNADMRQYISRLLAPLGAVTTVNDGAQAWQVLGEAACDLLVTDMMMPHLDGGELLRRIRASETICALPVIVLSAQAGEEARVTGLQQGADDYLVKPFNALELIARVQVQLMRGETRRAEDLTNRRLAEVFRSAPVGVALLRGPDHVYEYANPVYQAIVGNRAMAGTPVRIALPEIEGQGIFELLDEVYRTGKLYNGHARTISIRNVGEDRLEERCFEFVFQPLLNDATATSGIAIVVMDVSELMSARMAAEAASRSKDEFIAMLGHELRNPLAPISTALQLMKLRHKDISVNERAVIDRQVKHMVRLVDDLLDVSRIARGALELRREPVELATVVDKALETASPLFEKMHQRVVIEVSPHGLMVHADAVRLSQVISNVLTNAAKFGGEGGEISIEAIRQENQVTLNIRDRGAGMTPQEVVSVFEMFVQGMQGKHRPQGGLGLGLAIARNLATLHEGTLTASSEGLGKGSTFTLKLPIMELAPNVCDESTAGSQATRIAGRRILVVDDLEDVALLMRDLLEELGHEVFVAFDGPRALKMLELEGPVDVAILDLGLPVMDGFELAQHIRHVQAQRPPFLIALSGFGQDSDKQKSLASGFDVHLVKPVDIDVLLKVIAGAQ